MGKQAQLDWKESIPFILSSGETIDVNIFVLLLSYSRFRIYKVSLSKTQDILFSFLDDAFETFGGVSDEIVTDNMKAVMDEARIEHQFGHAIWWPDMLQTCTHFLILMISVEKILFRSVPMLAADCLVLWEDDNIEFVVLNKSAVNIYFLIVSKLLGENI